MQEKDLQEEKIRLPIHQQETINQAILSHVSYPELVDKKGLEDRH